MGKAQREACLINDTGNLQGHMNNKIEKSKLDISASTQPTPKLEFTKFSKSQDKQQKLLHRIMIFSFVMQAALIGIRGNFDVVSGKPLFDVLQGMIAQGIELILKAQQTEESIKKRDR